MDNNDPYNQQQPGQVVTPQPINPAPTPQMQPQQPPYPSPAPPQQAYTPPAQTVTPYQAPVPQQQYDPNMMQQPVYSGGSFASKLPSKKLMIMIAGAMAALTVVVLLATSFLGGLKLTTFDDSSVNFTVSLPDGWETQSLSVNVLEQVKATLPTDDGNSYKASVIIARQLGKSYADTEAFKNEVESRQELLSNENLARITKKEYSNLKLESYGTDEKPAFRLSYDAKNTETEQVTKFLNYYVYESNTTSVIFSFEQVDVYSGLSSSVNDIINSYKLR
jgi:hypothetical protein